MRPTLVCMVWLASSDAGDDATDAGRPTLRALGPQVELPGGEDALAPFAWGR